MSRILMVDDVAAFRHMARTVLSFDSHELLEAESGPQAVVLAASTAPDLVLMDIWMPGAYDGIEACRRIRQLPGLSAVPVVMLTASDDMHTRTQARAAGACAYLVKPFRPSELMQVLQQCLGAADMA